MESNTTGFPMSYRWSAHVTKRSSNGGWKSDFFAFVLNKIQIKSNSLLQSVFVRKCQRQSYSITIPHLTVHRYWRET